MANQFKRGDRVAVINQTYSGKFIVEGYANVWQSIGDGRYVVRFDDGVDCERFIDPAAQADPNALVKALNNVAAAR